jgi:hypothetical protein
VLVVYVIAVERRCLSALHLWDALRVVILKETVLDVDHVAPTLAVHSPDLY